MSGATETVALHQTEDVYSLHGYKWFSSATDSDMSLTLARLEGETKLSMFYLKTRDEAGQLNNIQVTVSHADTLRRILCNHGRKKSINNR